MLRPRIVAPVALLAAALLYACSSERREQDLGTPPPGGVWNPGPGAGNGPYGSGAPPPGEVPYVCPLVLRRCAVTVTYPAGAETSVEVRGNFRGDASWKAGVPMVKAGDTWTASIPVPPDTRVLYKFCIEPSGETCKEWRVDPAKPAEGSPPFDNNILAPVTCEQDFVCEKDPEDEGPYPAGVFDWRDSVMYFLFVDRFFDSDAKRCPEPAASGPISQYLGGDWKGVQAKIPYLKALGVNTLWLTVPMDNTATAGKGIDDDFLYSGFHGYWPEDLASAENCFGAGEQTKAKSLADLKDLVAALHAEGMKVLLDYAMVHVHKDSTTFKDNPDWFWPNDNGKGSTCLCGKTCDWNADGLRCWFTDYLPHWNFTRPAALKFSVDNAMEWITKAAPAGDRIDGFRLDAIKHVEASWLTELRRRVQADVVPSLPAKSRFYMVGETFDYSPSYLATFVDPDTKLDGQFDFPERAEIVEAMLLKRKTMGALAAFMTVNRTANYGPRAVMSPFIGNHDLARVIHLAQNNRPWSSEDGTKARAWVTPSNPTLVPQPTEREAYERLGAAFAVLFTNRGIPLVYYGDEVGLAGAGDPDNRRPMPFCPEAALSADGKTLGRVCTPADGPPAWNAGQTWLHDRVAKLAAIRAAHPALRRGTLETLPLSAAERADVWAYRRRAESDTVYVVVNRADEAKTVQVLPNATYDELVTGGTVSGTSVTVPPREARVLVAR